MRRAVETRMMQAWGLAAVMAGSGDVWALGSAGSGEAPSWLTVTWVALMSAFLLGVALRLGIKALARLRLITHQAAHRARGQARVLIGALVLLSMVFPYVVRQQPLLALILLLGMGMGVAVSSDAVEA